MTETAAYIGLGSNLGEREGFIKKALAMLDETAGITVCRVSSVIETLPLGGVKQPTYLNAVVEVKTSLDAKQLLGQLQKIENTLGRVRQESFSRTPSSRTIDLDILLFGQEIINEPGLVVPHQQLHLRSFVLNGLQELNSTLIHPVLKRSVAELASRLNGKDFVSDSNLPQLISIGGIIGIGKTTLAKGLAENLGTKLLLEAYDTNPFLAKVYAGQKELALDSQLYFLMSRLDQIGKEALGRDKIAVSDYVFETEQIYARRLLDPQQQSLYFKINALVSEKISPPVVAVYLKDTPQNCLDRIHQRNRPYEQRISLEFLQTQCYDYEELAKNWTQCPIITIDAAEFDCRDAKNVAKLTDEVKAYIATK